MARRLRRLGARAGDRVATTLPAGLAFAQLLHALPRIDAVLVPLNARLTSAERRWIVRDCGARLVLDGPPDGEEADGELSRAHDPEAPHSLLYTSGTTARPKQVLLSYRNHEASALASQANLAVRSEDRWLCALPIFHVGGLAILLRSAIYGTAAILHERFDVSAVAAALESGEATLVSLVATMLRRLKDEGLDEAPALRAALVGGGPVPRDLLEWSAEHGLPVLQTYGLTETASQIATLAAGEAISKLGSAGRPLRGVEIRISPRDEILVRGDMVSSGALAEDGWLHTGDRGRLDADGYLYVEGRLTETIVSGGENVSAAEVEGALVSHPAVGDAAVVGRADREWGEAVHAYVVLRARVSDDQLIDHCRGRLAAYKVPKAIHRVPEIPRTATGKVWRSRLP